MLGSAAVSTSYSSAAAIVSNPKAKKYGISCDLIRSRKINQLKLNGGSTVGGLEMSVRGGGGTTFLSGWEDGSDNDESGHLYEERDGDRDEGKGNEFKESGGDECEKGGGEDEEEERCAFIRRFSIVAVWVRTRAHMGCSLSLYLPVFVSLLIKH